MGDAAFGGDIAALRAAVVGLPRSVQRAPLDQIPAPPSVVDFLIGRRGDMSEGAGRTIALQESTTASSRGHRGALSW